MTRKTLNEYAAEELAPFPTSGIWTTFPQIDGQTWESLFKLRYGNRLLFTKDSALFKDTLKFRASVSLPFFKDKLDALAGQLAALKADETETTSTLYSPPDGLGTLASEYVAGKNVVKVKGAAGTNVQNMTFIQKEFTSVYMQALDSFGNLFFSVLDGEVLTDED